MKKVLFLLCLFLQPLLSFSKIPVGEWRTHFSYNSANQVVYADGKVYVEAGNKLYSYSYSNTEKFETYTTLTGLSGHRVTSITWCEAENTLIIVYSDGNIDFLTKSGVINLPDFKNKSMTADKTVYGIRVEGTKAYLSTGVGLMVIDVSKREISDTYSLSFTAPYTKVYDAAMLGDTLIVVTESGLYGGNVHNNLQDASFWSKRPFPTLTKATKMVRFNSDLFALGENGITYRKSPASDWSPFQNDPATTKLIVQNGYLFICAGSQTYMFNSQFERMEVESIQNNGIALNPGSDTLYIASGNKGLTMLTKASSKFVIFKDSIKAGGPAGNVVWKGFFKDGTFYATAGGQAKNWGDRAFYEGNILTFKDEKWSDLSNKEGIIQKTKVPFMDLLNLAIDPDDSGHYFATSWGEGLYEFRNANFYKLHTNKNSPLVSSVVRDSSRYIRVDAATFDADKNLWVLNSNARNPLQILKKEGGYVNWSSTRYPLMPLSETWNSLLFTRTNQVWMSAMRKSAGIFVLDNNHTIDVNTDDRSRLFTSFTDQDGNVLSPYYINCVTEDPNGSIWIGTVFGPIIASNPYRVFDADFTFTRVKIPRNDGTDNADYLLNNIRINCITVDAANRKWIGTNGNGVYLVSADGLETIHHFTTENSPVPSDYVWSVTVDPETGEVFIGTESGLVSYRSDATRASVSYEKIHVFPNPVKPEYTGKITVTGLMENSQVKISDLSGRILIAGNSLGGQFSWNGNTVDGKRAASGVYIVFCASEDGTQSQTCKFMIVK